MKYPKSMLKKILKIHNDATKWDNSSFEHIKRISNTKVGEVGQDFLEELCGSLGYGCEFPMSESGERSRKNSWDMIISKSLRQLLCSVELEIKTATEDVSGNFQFNHIRYHRSYQGLLCLGISPENIYFNVWSKAEVATGNAGRLVSMEKNGNASYKLTKKPADLYDINDFAEKINIFLEGFKV